MQFWIWCWHASWMMKPAEQLADASCRNLCLVHSAQLEGLNAKILWCCHCTVLSSLWLWSDKGQTVTDAKALRTAFSLSQKLSTVVSRYIKLLHKKWLKAWLDSHVSTALATHKSFSPGKFNFYVLSFLNLRNPQHLAESIARPIHSRTEVL